MNLEKQLKNKNLNIKKDGVEDTFSKLPVIQEDEDAKICNFQGYDVESLMKETSQLRKLITKRGTLKS